MSDRSANFGLTISYQFCVKMCQKLSNGDATVNQRKYQEIRKKA
ncbi:hypothetical protein [Nostoc punctiforme]|nr:hypothetical protein [Nostoc punctiforme]